MKTPNLHLLVLLLQWTVAASGSKSKWTLKIYTGHSSKAGTDADIYLRVIGEHGNSEKVLVNKNPSRIERKSVKGFYLEIQDVGRLDYIEIFHSSSGSKDEWQLEKIEMQKGDTRPIYTFVCECWLNIKKGTWRKLQADSGVSDMETLIPASNLSERRNLESSGTLEYSSANFKNSEVTAETLKLSTEFQGASGRHDLDTTSIAFQVVTTLTPGISSTTSAASGISSLISVTNSGTPSITSMPNRKSFDDVEKISPDTSTETTINGTSAVGAAVSSSSLHGNQDDSVSKASPSSPCNCPCSADFATSVDKVLEVLSDEARKEKLRNLVKGMKIDKKTLSSYRRKKSSEPDHRPSATAVGGLGLIMLVTPFAIIISSDLFTLVRYLLTKNL